MIRFLQHKRPSRRGFTLVEMLVATALVVLMMLLFAQVFQVASGLVSEQKGLAELDQDVRTMTILFRGDIGQRTFRNVVPFASGTATVGVDPERLGFFSISENNPDNNTDDVLHLTIKVNEGEAREGSPQLPFSGKATLIRQVDASGNPVPADDAINDDTERRDYLLANRNQPEFDDGQLTVNGTGSSRYAEVCWFLRNGILYRRQFLIREPYDIGTTGSDQPQDAAANPLIPFDYGPLNVPPIPDGAGDTWHDAEGRFWYDFDYAAFHDPANGLQFHSAPTSLENIHPGSGLGSFPSVPRSLSIPCLRFGNSLRRGLAATPQTPAIPPREFLDPAVPSTYIGRFTMQETAHSAFTYPTSSPAASGPFVDTSLTLGPDGLVSQYSNENGRRGEDIVMTNVHSFDIQVWDDGLATPAFVNLGNAAGGDYGTTANTTYGNRYDTWHPNPAMGTPPYRPLDSTGTEAIPLRAILIRIRFFDVGSDQLRDLTFTFPLNI